MRNVVCDPPGLVSISWGRFHLSPTLHKLQKGVSTGVQTLPVTVRWGKFNFSSPERC